MNHNLPDHVNPQALLNDTLDGNRSTIEICAAHNHSILDYVDWLESEQIQHLFERLERAAVIRNRAIAAAHASQSLANIAAIATGELEDATPSQRAEIRRAANTILKLAQAPNPPMTSGTGVPPVSSPTSSSTSSQPLEATEHAQRAGSASDQTSVHTKSPATTPHPSSLSVDPASQPAKAA